MFTGIIEAIGEVKSYDPSCSKLIIKSSLFKRKKVVLGASIAIDGVCLTASHFFDDEELIGFDLGQETKKLTLLGQKKPGDKTNIELSLRFGDPVDGHLVQGHVDAICELLSIDETEDGMILCFSLPKELKSLIAHKGAIAINGVSLTINHIAQEHFFICLVPHTIKNTTFNQSYARQLVHIETDIIGRYLARNKEL